MPPEQLQLLHSGRSLPVFLLTFLSRHLTYFPASSVLLFLNPETSVTVSSALVYPVRPLLGGVACTQPSYTWESQASSRHFLLGTGYWTLGKCPVEPVSLIIIVHVRCWDFPPRINGMLLSPRRPTIGEDGQPEVLNPTRAHRRMWSACPTCRTFQCRELPPGTRRPEDTDHGGGSSGAGGPAIPLSVTFPSHVVLTLPVAERGQSSFQEKGMGLFLEGGVGGRGSNSLII